MDRTCEVCGKHYTAKRAAAKYCGDTCRKRAQRGMSIVAAQEPDMDSQEPDTGLMVTVTRELSEAGVLETTAGQSAILLARRLSSGQETGSAMAALSKQLQALVSEAMSSVAKVDRMDEIKKRRDAKLAAAGRA